MKKLYFILSFALLLACFTLKVNAQSVGISNAVIAPDVSSMLEVQATNKGALIPRVALTSILDAVTIATPATSLLVYNTATLGVPPNNVIPGYYYNSGTSAVPNWKRFATGNGDAWTVGGNTFTGGSSYILGTISNDHVDLFSNNLVRGRLSNLGEFFIGTTATAMPGDLMNSVGSAAFPWAANGYTSFNGGGVYGAVMAGATNYSAIEGAYMGTGNGCGVLGGNASSGTGPGVSGQYTGSYNNTLSGAYLYAVRGYSNPSIAGYGRVGVMGMYNGAVNFGYGVYGLAAGGAYAGGNNDIAVVGWRANNSNYSGYFNGNHVIANGTKSASVGTSKGNQLLYAMESPEVWFEDFGIAQLVNGSATVNLDNLFIETTIIDDTHPMHVFIQVQGECEDVYVITNKASFTVKEKKGGSSNVKFSYRIVAKRINFQDHRFGNDPVWGPGDTRAYMQYATPPPLDYYENVKFQEEQKKNWKPTPLPLNMKYFNPQDMENLTRKPSESKK